MKKRHIDILNHNERDQLKKRIMSSIFRHQNRRKRVRRGAGMIAASMTIMVALFFFYDHNRQTSSIENYANTTESVIKSDLKEVTLVLEDKHINIKEDNSSIKYSGTGEKINIDGSEALSQKNKKDNQIVYNTLIIPYGKRSQIQLSDGSKVWLNSGSKLIYPVTFSNERREVYLEGEGIFDVAHNPKQPFIVMSKNHEIEVLGTVFNVSNYLDEESISTTLKSGSVQIKYKTDSFFKSNKTLKIAPGTQSVYQRNTNKISANEVDIEKYFSWRDGVLIFKNDDLQFIMKRLSRYYNVDIVVNDKDLGSGTFSGYLDLKENVENVIQIIEQTTDFEYTVNNNQIIIN